MRLLLCIICFVVSAACIAQPVFDTERKARIDQQIKKEFTRALLVYQDGKLVYQYGDAHQAFLVFSVRKSLLSLLYGIYIKEGKINPNATLATLGIDDKPTLTEEEKKATVMDLLTARSGVYHVAAFETPGMEKNRPTRGQYKPGEHWFYNNWDFNALTTIFEKTTGQSVFAAFEERIAKPVQLEDFDLKKQSYFRDTVSNHPAPLWQLSASDLGKVGLLMLNQGMHNKRQVIPSEWIAESTRPVSDLGMFGGYGYCWWVAMNGKHFPFVTLPDGTFSARGTGEQVLLVIPSQNLVLVHLTEVKGPNEPMLKVTDFGRLLKVILE